MNSHSRAPTPTFNEKALCGLGKGRRHHRPSARGRRRQGARRAADDFAFFATPCGSATYAVWRRRRCATRRTARSFSPSPSVQSACKIELLSGQQEARLSALGVVSSIHKADGIVGDLGRRIARVDGCEERQTSDAGLTLPLGGLSLMDLSERSPKKAAKIVREALANVKLLQSLCQAARFYAVGGTWRALARLHMRQRQYPMNVMHNYVIPSRDALEFARLVERIEADALDVDRIGLVRAASASRLRRRGARGDHPAGQPEERSSSPRSAFARACSSRSFRSETQEEDPLIVSAREFNRLRSRAPSHGEELFDWTSRLLASSHLEEDEEDRRLRHAACLLSDISWRAHPDYRGDAGLRPRRQRGLHRG